MNNSQMRRDLDNAARQDLAAFIHRTFQTVTGGQTYHHNWHIDAIAWELMQCWRGNTKRLVITLPPRHLKSICASVAFPAWVLGQDPTQRIVCASYSENLASKHALDCRAMMEPDFYRRIFPRTCLSPKKNTDLDFMTTQRGNRYATSVGGTLTGRGGNFIIIDDPLKPEEAFSEAKRPAVNEWYDRTLVSRLDDKSTGVIIVIMQRLHLEDLVGHVKAKGGPDWRWLQLPAIAQEKEYIFIDDGQIHYRAPGDLLDPQREPLQVLNQLKRDLGNFNFSAQYLQRPLPLEGEIIKWSWFPRYDELPAPDPNDSVVQSWDTASKPGGSNDYSVCTTWLVKGQYYYLMDVLRLKLNYPDLKKTVIRHAFHHRADTLLIEDKDSGTALIQELQNAYSGGPPTIGFKPQGDKQTRMFTQSSKIEQGRVLLPRTALWLDDFQVELLQFPHGRYDDQVDSMSQALMWFDQRDQDQGSFSYTFA